MSNNDIYLGNPNLKKSNVPVEFTKENIEEYSKCMYDPKYFIENYIKIVNIDEGLVPFKMYGFQKKMVDTFHKSRFTICKLPRQSGKSTTIVSYLLHYVIFNENVNVAILANKSSTAREILGRLQLAYENLPKWMQQGVINWNKGSIELENGSRIVAAATSSSAIRGSSFNIIFLDEFAFVPTNIAEAFFSSVYPTISSGKTSKVMIVSTPYGFNQFYKLWSDALKKRNDYVPIEVHWSEVPGRDEKWKEETIRNTSERQFASEFECEFLGSVDTLINPTIIRNMTHDTPIRSDKGLDIYKKAEKNHQYVVCVDVARGVDNDFSSFVVIDVSSTPYKIVAKYKNNEIKPILFPHIVYDVAKIYNKAYVLVETNDMGQQVAEALHYELEYENVVTTMMKGRAGQIMGSGFAGKRTQFGVRMTKQVKRIGCSNLKSIIESSKLIINDFDIINELSTFAQRGNTFQAEEGSYDDLVMCLVMFSWMINQRYFKELINIDIRQKLYDEQQHNLEQDLTPFGYVDDGTPPEEQEFTDVTGTRWSPIFIKKGL